MGHAYKLLFVFRPLVWMLVAMLVAAFGRVFFKRLVNVIAIFLLILGICGAVYMTKSIQYCLDPFNFPTTDDWMLCIVGSVTTLFFLTGALGYMLFGRLVDDEDEKASKHRELFGKIIGWMLALSLPLAIMGYSIPFFLLDNVVAYIVGILGELGGIVLMVIIIKKMKE